MLKISEKKTNFPGAKAPHKKLKIEKNFSLKTKL